MQNSVIRSAFHFLTGTLISRFGGFARDVLMAFYFGTFAETAAFFIAYRMSNLFRRIFAEGALLNGFVPFYEKLSLDSQDQGFKFFRDLSFSLSVFLFIFVAILEGGIWIFYPKASDSVQYILRLSAIMLPSLIFICLFGLFNSYLQCKGRFFVSGVIPFVFNLTWIVSIVLSKSYPIGKALSLISFGIFSAFVIQWLVVLFFSIRSLRQDGDLRSFLKPSLFPASVKQMIAPFFASVIGVSAMQINSGLDVIFARIASLEGPAYLSYAIRIQQLPIAFLGVSIASALLPLLSKKFELGLKEETLSILQETLRKVFIALVFCTFGLFALGFAGLNVVYGRGGFNALSLHFTLRSLWMYGLGLLPGALVIILAPVFYAQKDFKTPMKSSIIAVIANIVINSLVVFVFHTNAEGIAFATSLSSWINSFYLFRTLHKHNFRILNLKLIRTIAFSTVVGASSCIATQWIGFYYFQDTSVFSLFSTMDKISLLPRFLSQVQLLFILSCVYIATFLLFGIFLRLFVFQELYRWAVTKTKLKIEKT